MRVVREARRFNFAGLFLVAAALLLLWFFRPWFHGFAMAFYRNPILIELFVLLYLLNRYLFRGASPLHHLPHEYRQQASMGIILILLFAVMPAVSIIGQVLPQAYLASHLDYSTISSLPETKANIRLMPYEVAYRYSKDALQLSQYQLGTGNIGLIGGKLSWMFPLVPSSELIKYTLKNKGIIYVDATTQEKTNNLVSKELSIGEGMKIFDNLYWAIYKSKYFVDLDEPFYIPTKDGEIYTVISAIDYEVKQSFGLLYAVPRFAGVFLADSSGKVEFLSPEQALENPVLKGNRLFPEPLARYYVESYAYNKGIVNKFFFHEDQIEIRDVNSANRQPFLMDTTGGLKWFISTEPYGESRGIFKIFLVDAATGKIGRYELDPKDTLTGPVKATDFVRRANPIVDWNRFQMVEPLPFITGSELYWKVVVIPYDAAGIAYQAFVNSRTNDVVALETDSQIQEFILRGAVSTKPEEKKEPKEDIVAQIRQKLKETESLVEKLEKSG